MSDTEQDFLCHIPFGMGGSYGRSSNRTEAIQRAYKAFISDWSSYYDVSGQDIKCVIADVTGHDKVYFGPGIYSFSKDGDEQHFDLEPMSVKIPPFKSKQRLNSKSYRKKLDDAVLEAINKTPQVAA